MAKKLITLLMALAMILSLAACGTTPAPVADPTTAPAADAAEPTEETTASEEPVIIGKTDIILGYGATYERCMELLKEGLEERGYTVTLMMFDSNELPAKAMANGEIDGLMQNHLPWIKNFNEANGTDFVMPEPYITYSLVSLYSLKYSSVDELPDNAVIAIQSDAANMEKGLLILEDAGLIELGEKADANYTLLDITSNPKNLQFVEVETNAGVAALPDVDAAVCSAYRLWKAGYDPKLGLWDFPGGKDYPLSLVVKSEDANASWVKACAEIIRSDAFRNGFNEYYQGSYVLFDE